MVRVFGFVISYFSICLFVPVTWMDAASTVCSILGFKIGKGCSKASLVSNEPSETGFTVVVGTSTAILTSANVVKKRMRQNKIDPQS